MQHRDPVCGKTITDAEIAEVDAGTSKYATKKLHGGKWHYFCGLLCRMKFAGNPSGHLEPPSTRKA